MRTCGPPHTCKSSHTYWHARASAHAYAHAHSEKFTQRHLHAHRHSHLHILTHTYTLLYTFTQALTHIHTGTHRKILSCRRKPHAMIGLRRLSELHVTLVQHGCVQRTLKIDRVRSRLAFVTKFVHISRGSKGDCRKVSQSLPETSHSTTAEARILHLNRPETVLGPPKRVTEHMLGG